MHTTDFDLTTILGCSIRDTRVQRLLEFCEEAPEPSERFPTGFYYLQFRRTGFSLLVNESECITTVHVYTQPDGEYAAYTRELPFGVAAHMSQVEARSLLCPPSESGGPMQFMASMPVTYWDIWEFGDHSVHLEYPEDRLSIRLVTLNFVSSDSTNATGNV